MDLNRKWASTNQLKFLGQISSQPVFKAHHVPP